LHIDNQRKHAVETSPDEMKPMMKKFFRKGLVLML
jgi:hypothetical protein